MKLRRIFLATTMLLTSVAAVSQQSDASFRRPAVQSDAPFTPSSIGPGDLLQIHVFHTPELDTQARVDSDGMVVLPLIGAFHVAGLTAQQAGQQIRKLLSDANYISNLDVTVFVAENATQRVSILGEVKNPGSIPLSGRMRLLDVISAAGGLVPTSSGAVTISHRDETGKAQTLRVNGPLATMTNPEVRPGDTIMAEKAGIVYVVGSVNRPGGFVLEGGKKVTLLQALALAEGSTGTAVLRHARLIRNVNGERKMIDIDLKALLRGKGVKDEQMQDDDILFIPNSVMKDVLRSGIHGAMDIAAGASIYHL
jgi:polysaccharide export outer membrane protein